MSESSYTLEPLDADPVLATEDETDGTGYALQPREQTYAAEFPGYVMGQYFQQPILKALLESFLETGQSIETAILELRDQRNPHHALGPFLDQLGEDVGIERGGRSDAAYRILVLGRIALNKGSGTPDDLLQLAATLVNHPDNPIYIEDVGGSVGAQAWIDIVTSESELDPAAINAQLQLAKPAGVRLTVQFGPSNDPTFQLSDGYDVMQTSSAIGFAHSATPTVGGSISLGFDE
jgi:hypothetical protein